MLPDAFMRALEELLSPARVLNGAAELSTFESDGLTTFRVRPEAVLLPETADEVVGIVRLCNEHAVPFSARGSGTSLSGGSTPVPGGVVIALNRLNRILKLEPEAGLCVVEPGVTNSAVSSAAAPYRLRYAPDPSSGPVCTIGGNVAFNAGGAHCLRYGMTANHVLGLKVVLPDGELCSLGGESFEACGPDLAGFFTGSEGLFGIVLEVTLRLVPISESFDTFLVTYASLDQCGEAVASIISTGLLPGALEIMDRLAMDAVNAAMPAGYPDDAQAVLVVELEGPEDEVRAERDRLLPLLEKSHATSVTRADTDFDRDMIWKGRKSAFSAAGRLAAEYIVQDGVVPRSRLGEALRMIDSLSERHGIRVANVFHAGDGNLHPLIMFDSQAGELPAAEALAGDILRMCIALGGAITGEHGVGLEKRPYLPEQYPGLSYALMVDVQTALDPLCLANPGKMLIREAA